MKPAQFRTVHRYLLPLDAFVRIRVVERGDPPLRARPGLDRVGYRALVLEACCPELGPDPAREMAQRCPEEPEAALDLLYQLCIEVNPCLDIHTVRLTDEPASTSSPRRETRAPSAEVARKRLMHRVRGLEHRLGERVIGQDAAIAQVVAVLRRAAAGLNDPRRPLATCLFVGRTGTGKTELARAISDELFGENALVRIDCSEYGLGHESARLSGAPPGYVGHEQGGVLTDALAARPDRVVLFDEIEKAHPRLHHLLLSVLDDGRLTDGRSRVVDFTRALIVLTSNCGAIEAGEAARRMGFARAPGSASAVARLEQSQLTEIVDRSLASQFTPEFLGRVGARILFRDLEARDAVRIAERLVFLLALRLRRRGWSVAFSSAVPRWLAERGAQTGQGVRGLEHLLVQEVETTLCSTLLERPDRGLIRVRIRGGRPSIEAAA